MSEASIVTLGAAFLLALPPTLLALASLIQNIKTKSSVKQLDRKLDENTVLTDVLVQKTEATEKKVDEVNQKTDDQTLKIDAVNTKAEVIAGHVNSEKTAGLGREATYAAENKLLREMMVVLERAVASIAQASAVASVAQARPTIQVLEQIDRHAEQIEKNTASTEANVNALKSEGR